MQVNKIIFFGELPPGSIHGASISNAINLKILKNHFDVTIVNELYKIENHSTGYFKKITLFFKSTCLFCKKIYPNKYNIFYGVIYLSTIGIIKNITILLIFKLFNYNSKVILHFHRSDFKLFIKKPLNLFLFNLVYKFTNKFIILSRHQLSQFDNYDLRKFNILYNTIEYELTNSEFISKKYNITFLSNFIIEKGIIETIKSVIELNTSYNLPLILNLYGSYSSNKLENEIQTLIKSYNFIKVNKTVSGLDKMKVIGNSDLLILPSFNEGLPLVLLESMSLGIPIVITNVGYIEEALGSNYPLYCNHGDVESICNSVINYYENHYFNSLKNDLLQKYNCNYSNQKHKIDLLNIFKFEN